MWTPRVGDKVVIMSATESPTQSVVGQGVIMDVLGHKARVQILIAGVASVREFDLTRFHDDMYSTLDIEWVAGYDMMQPDHPRAIQAERAQQQRHAWDEFAACVERSRLRFSDQPDDALRDVAEGLEKLRRTVAS